MKPQRFGVIDGDLGVDEIAGLVLLLDGVASEPMPRWMLTTDFILAATLIPASESDSLKKPFPQITINQLLKKSVPLPFYFPKQDADEVVLQARICARGAGPPAFLPRSILKSS